LRIQLERNLALIDQVGHIKLNTLGYITQAKILVVTRTNPYNKLPGSYWPEQAINLEETVKIFTLNNATALRLQNITGAITVGKSADLDDVILGLGNLPQIGKEKFVTPCLITTFVGGPIGSPACHFLGPNAPEFADKRTDEDFSWRAGLEWKPADDLLLYANLTTGYRSGGFSLPFAGAATEFDPEELFAQELGVKSRFLDNTLQIMVGTASS
jgi:outer membrane receptor protein involved in Fe transport